MISYLVSLEGRTSKLVEHNCSYVENMHTIHLIWYKDTCMVNVVFCEAVLAVACSLAVSAGLMLCQAIPCPLAPPSAACAFECCSSRENQVHVKDLEIC